jgi:hypothetical protein
MNFQDVIRDVHNKESHALQFLNNSGIAIPTYDYAGYTATNDTTDTWVFKTGGASGTTVATIVIVYTDTTKVQTSTITKT